MRARNGDQAAWAALVDSFSSLIWSVAWSFGLEKHRCEDAVQAVWLRLVQNLDRIDDPQRLAGWIATTTRRECMAVSKKERLNVPTEQIENLSPSFRPDDTDLIAGDLDRRDEVRIVRSALSRLDHRCRSLFEFLGADPSVPYEQISAEMDMPVGSIGPTRARCLEHLRRDPEIAGLLHARGQL